MCDPSSRITRSDGKLIRCIACSCDLLVPVILKKLHKEIWKNIAREQGSSNWTLSDLQKCQLKELNVMEACNAINYNAENLPTTATFLTKTKPYHKNIQSSKLQYLHSENDKHLLPPKKIWAFCKGPHSSAECTKITDYTERINIVKRDNLCFNCLGRNRIADCKSKTKCRNCSLRHHTGLCKDTLQKTDERTRAQVTLFENHNGKESSPSVQLHSALTHSQGHVLLKSAVAPVSSGQTSLHANILLDEGAQRSFITLADKLELVPTGKEALSISGFGDTSSNMRELPTATVYLQTETETIPMDVLIVPEIAVPLRTYPNKINNMKHLTGLKLAHPATNDGYFEIMVLIGADYYWNIVQDRVIRGNGFTAVESKIGYLLSGPTTGCNKKLHPTSMMYIIASHSVKEVDLERYRKVESLGIEKMEFNQTYENYLTEYQSVSITRHPPPPLPKDRLQDSPPFTAIGVDFTPQRAPWYGGWWEDLIGLTKNCLRKVLGKVFVSLVELQKVITEVECILNNRPMTYMSSYPADEQLLTPSHLPYGRTITSLTCPDELPDEA